MERTICEKCGKWAIKTGTGITLTSYPPQYPQIWKCACGWMKDADVIHGKTDEEVFTDNWSRAQT